MQGPFGIIVAPSRELVRQTYDVVRHFTTYLEAAGYPELRTMLCIGGEDRKDQLACMRDGCHMIVATPGRLNDFLNRGFIRLDVCKYICLDEADRMMDVGFDEAMHATFSHFKSQRQTVLYSATMPSKFRDFATQSLVNPVVVNVGRAGAANLDVIQEVEYVKQESKIVYLLQCLQKTAPPVLIFSESSSEVDEIHEYLMLKGVAAVSVHGSKDQVERRENMASFRSGEADVLCATDVASKGLDFPDIKHVINFDMPKEIENYVHRIGRTGRSGKTGVATTFINKNVEESVMLDLKHLLIEAKQRVPPVLRAIYDPTEEAKDLGLDDIAKGCQFCGGLGHRITNCPKLESVRNKVNPVGRDALREGSGGW